MYSVAVALKTFFSGFDLPAYTVDNVPDEVTLPHITYPLVEPEWNQEASFYCQVWYPKNHLEELLSKADSIVAEIGIEKKIKLTGGYLVLHTSTPLLQKMSDDYSESMYINLSIRAYHMPGE